MAESKPKKKSPPKALPMWEKVDVPIPDDELDKLDKCPKCGDFFWVWNGIGEMRCGNCKPLMGHTKRWLMHKKRILGA